MNTERICSKIDSNKLKRTNAIRECIKQEMKIEAETLKIRQKVCKSGTAVENKKSGKSVDLESLKKNNNKQKYLLSTEKGVNVILLL